MQRLLVERAMQGDHDAFADLVRAATDRLFAVASLILDGDRGQDAVQDALVAAWRDIRGLRDPDAWDAWLYRLTVRACYRAAGNDRRRHVVELSAAPDHAPASLATSRSTRPMARPSSSYARGTCVAWMRTARTSPRCSAGCPGGN